MCTCNKGTVDLLWRVVSFGIVVLLHLQGTQAASPVNNMSYVEMDAQLPMLEEESFCREFTFEDPSLWDIIQRVLITSTFVIEHNMHNQVAWITAAMRMQFPENAIAVRVRNQKMTKQHINCVEALLGKNAALMELNGSETKGVLNSTQHALLLFGLLDADEGSVNENFLEYANYFTNRKRQFSILLLNDDEDIIDTVIQKFLYRILEKRSILTLGPKAAGEPSWRLIHIFRQKDKDIALPFTLVENDDLLKKQYFPYKVIEKTTNVNLQLDSPSAFAWEAGAEALRKQQNLTGNSAIRELHRRLDKNQFPENCSKRKLLAFQWSHEHRIQGFAAMYQFLAASLTIAYHLNRTLVEFRRACGEHDLPAWELPQNRTLRELKLPNDIPANALQGLRDPRIEAYPEVDVVHDSWLRAPAEKCGNTLFTCYMHNFSSCHVTTSTMGLHVDDVPLLDPKDKNQEDRIVRINSLHLYKQAIKSATHPKNIPRWFKELASTLSNNKMQTPESLWFPAFEQFLFKPLSHILQTVPSFNKKHQTITTIAAGNAQDLSAVERTAQNSAAMVGVHIRQGDAGRIGRGNLSLGKVFQETARLIRSLKYNHAMIFFATDNASLRDDVTRFQRRGHSVLTLSHATWNLSQSGATLESTLSSSQAGSAAYAATTSIIQDIEMLQSCSFFIGACYSQVSRLAYELMLVRGNTFLPPVSGDWEACRDVAYHPYYFSVPWWPSFDVWAG